MKLEHVSLCGKYIYSINFFKNKVEVRTYYNAAPGASTAFFCSIRDNEIKWPEDILPGDPSIEDRRYFDKIMKLIAFA